MVPSYIAPSEFWNLSFNELPMIAQNINQVQWDATYRLLYSNRVLAGDISKVLGGVQFDRLETFMCPNPRSTQQRTVEEIERTLIQWSRES